MLQELQRILDMPSPQIQCYNVTALQPMYTVKTLILDTLFDVIHM